MDLEAVIGSVVNFLNSMNLIEFLVVVVVRWADSTETCSGGFLGKPIGRLSDVTTGQ